MCYSALVTELKKYKLRFKARIDLSLLSDYYRHSLSGEDSFQFKVTKAFESNFTHPECADERKIKELIDTSITKRIADAQQELFAYKKRLADAERKLAEKITKTAEKEKAVCERQVDRIKTRLDRAQAKDLTESDERIYAKHFTPIIVGGENGERVVRLARYLIRPAGQHPDFDSKYPGCYNARLDNLDGFPWKLEFGKNHAIVVIKKFFENVHRNVYEHRKLKPNEKPENMVVAFEPQGFEYIFVPCLYDAWTDKQGNAFHSFALITDAPPKEIAAAGHNRCPIFLRESAIDSWLFPKGLSKVELHAILQQREHPFYQHHVAAA